MTRTQYGTLAVIGSSAAIFWPGALIFGFPGVIGPHWQNMFGVGKGAIGNCLFFVLSMVGISMFLAGKLQERYGTRSMIRTGVVICALSSLPALYATNIYHIYVWAALNGLGSSLIYVPALTTVQKWFPQRRGLVSGTVNLSFGISAAIMAPIFRYLFDWGGYRAMNLIVGTAALATGILASSFTDVPERVFPPSGRGMPASPSAAVPDFGSSMTVAEAFRTKSFRFLWTTWALQGAACISMVTLSVSFGLHRGFSLTQAVLVLSCFNLTSGASRLISGYLSDFVEKRVLMSLAFLASGVAYFAMSYVPGLTILCFLAMVIGFSFGTLFACSAPLVTDCFGMKHFGAILGLVFTAYGFVSGIIGPSMSGYLIDITGGNYSIIFTYLGIFCLISGCLINFVMPPAPVCKADETAAVAE